MADDMRIFAATLRHDLPTLDLHGLYPSEALDKLELFLYNNFHTDTAAKIIYGIGTGKLKEEVTSYLRKHPMTDQVVEQDGFCIVLFAK